MQPTTPDPGLGDAVPTFFLGVWAFLGSAMRGIIDWRDPKTGRFSIGMFFVSVATALVLGEAAGAWGQSHAWEPYWTNALAGGLGYLGPAGTLLLVKNRLLGVQNDGAKSGDDTSLVGVADNPRTQP